MTEALPQLRDSCFSVRTRAQEERREGGRATTLDSGRCEDFGGDTLTLLPRTDLLNLVHTEMIESATRTSSERKAADSATRALRAEPQELERSSLSNLELNSPKDPAHRGAVHHGSRNSARPP